jgi:hypothetical protein
MTTKEVMVHQPEKSAVQVIDAQTLIGKAIESGSSIETMERLLAMRDKIRMELAENAFREAMSLFQARCPIIAKKKQVLDKNGKPRYNYAPLDDIVKQVQPLIEECGLSYDIDTIVNAEGIEGITTVVQVHHVQGFSKESRFFVPIDKSAYMTAPQMWASAQTFSKRYAFCNAFGILTGDEDTDAGDVKPEETKRPEPEKPVNNSEIVKKYAVQLKALPIEIVEQFKTLGYTQAPAALFCEKMGWDYPSIHEALKNLISKGVGNARKTA